MVADGRVKLSDFGIARLFGNTRLTSPATCWARRKTWPPSRPKVGRTMAGADLYSLGTLMYACWPAGRCFVASRSPRCCTCSGSSNRSRCANMLQRAEELERILAQLLEKDPSRRVPNANRSRPAAGNDVAIALSASPETAVADSVGSCGDEPLAAEEVRRRAAQRPAAAPEPDRPNGSCPSHKPCRSDEHANQAPARRCPRSRSRPSRQRRRQRRGHFVLVAEENLDRAPARGIAAGGSRGRPGSWLRRCFLSG